ncbi:MAG TPA: acyltransferase [Opitutaceae bacterium]
MTSTTTHRAEQPPLAPAPDLNGRLPTLDGLRGLAVIGVMLTHFVGQGSAPGWIGGIVQSIAAIGVYGVDLFFVLSGFLITGILIESKGGSHYFRSFYMRRVLRIFPLYFGVLLFFLVLVPLIRNIPPHSRVAYAQQGWLWLFSSNVIMAIRDQWVFNTPWLALGHFWSLAVEEHFYLVWPALVYFCSHRTLPGICLLAIVTAIGSRTWFVVNGNPELPVAILTICRIDALALGGLLAAGLRMPGMMSALRRPAWALAVASLGCLMFQHLAVGDYMHWGMRIPGFTAVALLFAALLYSTLAVPGGHPWARFWSCPPLVFFGKYSYALYVFHLPVIPVLNHVAPVSRFAAWTGSPLAGLLAYTAVGTVVCLGLALLSWHCYEKHFLSLKRFFPAHGKQAPRALTPVSRQALS